MEKLHRKPVHWVLSGLLCGLMFSLPWPSHAHQTLDTYFEGGRKLFRFDIFDKGEVFDEDEEDVSTWSIGGKERRALTEGTRYWQGILAPIAANSGFITITVGADDDYNASAASDIVEEGPYQGMTYLAAALIHGERFDSATTICLGEPLMAEAVVSSIKVLPDNGRLSDVTPIITHELAHALGFISNSRLNEDGNNYFIPVLTTWDRYLVDSFGNPSAPGMQILEGSIPQAGKFVLRPDRGYAFFQGPEVLRVLGGAMLDPEGNVYGLPIEGFEDETADLSHIELKNSLMSHQHYRNYAMFMEAELAAIKDLGYDIDLQNHFGRSVYTSLGSLVNETGFFARNADGSDWLVGQYNPSMAAIGLHVYGAYNTIVQAADILSAGPGSAGIRIDGHGYDAAQNQIFGNNHVTVAEGVRVHAHGDGGTGVMVTYGKEHVLVNRGDVAALGRNGVGVRFDFGSNMLSSVDEPDRGSYIRVDNDGDNNPDLASEGLDGALVSRFDLTGTVAGEAAAVYISDNALVEEINVMRGAKLYGDIVSHWDPDDPRVQAYVGGTTLSFGWLADASGEVTYIQDNDFALNYRGDILGRQGLDVLLAGGELTWRGTMDVHAYTQNADTALIGIIADSPSWIRAEEISLEQGSLLGATHYDGFQYGRVLSRGSLPVLAFDTPSLDQGASLMDTGGRFSMGAYDYSYGKPHWLDQQTYGVTITGRRFNRERGGASAVTAPLALAAHTSSDALMRRGIEVFSRTGTASGPDSMLLAWANGSAREISGRTLTGPVHLEKHVAEQGKRRDKAQWTAMAAGGAELSSGLSSLWVAPSYSYASRSGGSAYDIKSVGVRMGYDLWLNDRAFAGLALALDFPEYDSSHADITARSVGGSLYGGVTLPWDLELGLSGSFTHTNHDQKRKVLGKRYDSDYDAKSYNAGVNLGRTFALSGHAALRPFVGYDYTRLDVDGYDEGDGVYALKFDSTDYDLHRVTAGTDLGWTFANRAWVSGRVYYSGLYGDRKASTSAYFSMDPQSRSFTSKGDTLDQHALGLGLGAGLPVSDRLSLTGGYSFLGGGKVQTHTVEAGLKLTF